MWDSTATVAFGGPGRFYCCVQQTPLKAPLRQNFHYLGFLIMGYSRPFQKIQVREGSPKPLRTWLSIGSQTPPTWSSKWPEPAQGDGWGRWVLWFLCIRLVPGQAGLPSAGLFLGMSAFCILDPRNHKDLELFLNEAAVKGGPWCFMSWGWGELYLWGRNVHVTMNLLRNVHPFAHF